ncbi:MAG: hypothetical protein HXX20_24745, partial [Chloroflexi bacterium]|nr:hypothetical protein [Chloroflexota bacterium]
MKTMLKGTWHYLFGEPFIWIFRTIFQPNSFERETKADPLLVRVKVMFRVALPLFLFCFSLDLVILPVLYTLFPILDRGYGYFPFVSIAGGIAFSIAGGIAGGIAFGIAGGIAFGIA